MVLWATGEPFDSFIRLARQLPDDVQDRVFEHSFLRTVVRQVKTSYDPKIVPTVEKLIQGRCNYPPELTIRTGLWRNRGKARCKKTVRDGVYFCHVPQHLDFALRHDLPIECLPHEVRPKPLEEQRGQKKDDDPLRPSFRKCSIRKTSTTVRKKKKGHSSTKARKCTNSKVMDAGTPSQIAALEADASQAEPDDSCEVSKIVHALLELNRRHNPLPSVSTVMATNDSTYGHNTHGNVDLKDQCVFSDPLTGEKCQIEGAFVDPESPGCTYCCSHIFVPQDLLERLRRSKNLTTVYRDFETIHRLDTQLQALGGTPGSDADEQRRELSVRRFVLASNNGLGTHPMLLDWIRNKGVIASMV